jgi:CMP-N-acetylneuraminic acid synthetase
MIPQVYYNLNYTLKSIPNTFDFDPYAFGELEDSTLPFADESVIKLHLDNPLIYVEEINTELLTTNFDIEVFMVTGSQNKTLERKYFQKEIPQIVNGMLVSEVPKQNLPDTFTTNSVEYYFDILTDMEIDDRLACKGALVFNKQSYYVDLDFECDEETGENLFFDIYGSVTEPEICLD